MDAETNKVIETINAEDITQIIKRLKLERTYELTREHEKIIHPYFPKKDDKQNVVNENKTTKNVDEDEDEDMRAYVDNDLRFLDEPDDKDDSNTNKDDTENKNDKSFTFKVNMKRLKRVKIFRLLPLASELNLNYMTFSQEAMIELLSGLISDKKNEFSQSGQPEVAKLHNFKINREMAKLNLKEDTKHSLYSKFFNLNSLIKEKKKENLQFSSFLTNGKTVSILYRQITVQEYRANLFNNKKDTVQKEKKDAMVEVDKLTDEQREQLLNMNYMVIDLGHGDILYMLKMVKKDDKDYLKYLYTSRKKKNMSSIQIYNPDHVNFDAYYIIRQINILVKKRHRN
jgi:hypothetical protein